MPTTALARPAPPAEYLDLLDTLRQLTRGHLLAWHLEIGGVLLRRFFGGRADLYQSRDPHKELSFKHFVQTCEDELAVFGLSPASLANCVNAHIAFDTLPPDTHARLEFSHLVELARVADATLRARLALAATEGRWTVKTLQATVRLAKAGQWADTDPSAPGTQPPSPREERQRRPSARRLVAQAERLVPEIETWAERWLQADVDGLADEDQARAAAALAVLQARIEGVRQRLLR